MTDEHASTGGRGTGRTGEPTRRAFLRTGLAGLLAPSLLGCDLLDPSPASGTGAPRSPRLSARPGTPTTAPVIGESPLGLGASRDGLLYVPAAYAPDRPFPLVIGLHGSGGSAAAWRSWEAIADQRGFVFLAIDSRGSTWDLTRGSFGPDVLFVDAALAHTFERCRIDPEKVALVGYSNGASYGLSLGVLNGDLFTDLLGFATGFFSPQGDAVGRPRVFLAHGDADPVAPVSVSRGLAALLREDGYDVTYREFEGDHTIPSPVAQEGIAWIFS